MKNIANLMTVVLIASIILLSGCVEEESSVSPTSEDSTPNIPEQTVTSSDIKIPEYDNTLVRNYEIAKTEDISIKAMDKPLSAYSTSEIEELPMNIRKEYRVVVPSDISKEELKSTLIHIVMDETSANPDIDEVVIVCL